MKRIRAILLLMLFASVNLIFSQSEETKTIKLNWINDSNIILNEKETIVTDIIEGNFLDENLNPQFSRSWNISAGFEVVNFSIENVIFENVNKEKFNISALPNDIDAKLNIVNERNMPVLSLIMNPLVYKENSVKKIISFDLNYSLKTEQSISRKVSLFENSVLSEGLWYKFAIDTTGVYKIDKTFLEGLGLDLNNINPKNIRLFGNGGEMLPVKNSDFRYEDLQENAIVAVGEDDS